jgi:hypothetical protein
MDASGVKSESRQGVKFEVRGRWTARASSRPGLRGVLDALAINSLQPDFFLRRTARAAATPAMPTPNRASGGGSGTVTGLDSEVQIA